MAGLAFAAFVAVPREVAAIQTAEARRILARQSGPAAEAASAPSAPTGGADR